MQPQRFSGGHKNSASEMMDIDYNFKNVLDDFFIQTGIKLVRCTIVTGKDWEEIVEA